MKEKQCNKCKLIKPLEQFDRSKIYNDGRVTTCKACRKLYETQKRLQLADSTLTALDMCQQEPDKIGAIELLKNIGYEVNGKKTVYEQFKERIKNKYGVTLVD